MISYKKLLRSFLVWGMVWVLSGCDRQVDQPDERAIKGDTRFVLSDVCPPGFGPGNNGECDFHTLYNMPSAAKGGPGGLLIPVDLDTAGMTPARIDLGRYLFFDPILSDDQKMSCGHCHHPAYGFSDGLARSQGRGAVGAGENRSGGEVLPRSAPSLWNVGFGKAFNWDASAAGLEGPGAGPYHITSRDEFQPSGSRCPAK